MYFDLSTNGQNFHSLNKEPLSEEKFRANQTKFAEAILYPTIVTRDTAEYQAFGEVGAPSRVRP